jgi:hypothetical protein
MRGKMAEPVRTCLPARHLPWGRRRGEWQNRLGRAYLPDVCHGDGDSEGQDGLQKTVVGLEVQGPHVQHELLKGHDVGLPPRLRAARLGQDTE